MPKVRNTFSGLVRRRLRKLVRISRQMAAMEPKYLGMLMCFHEKTNRAAQAEAELKAHKLSYMLISNPAF